jgi:hypothetical protein
VPEAGHPELLVSGLGTRLIYPVVQQVFRRLCDGAGVGAGSSTRPRIHDYADLSVMPTVAGRPLQGWASVLAVSA